jgi:hypothetical protein
MNAGWNVGLPISLTPEEFAAVVAAARAGPARRRVRERGGPARGAASSCGPPGTLDGASGATGGGSKNRGCPLPASHSLAT